MGKLDTIAGNTGTIGRLRTALSAGTLPHAILLAAPDGCGRNYVARCLAADYLYPGGGPGAEAVMKGESPEVLLAEGEGKSGQIPVDRIRAVRSDVFLSSLSAAGRCVLIRDAQRMAAPAANALLKVLEEPPADVLFILTSHSAAALPATIVSRCALYSLSPLAVDECEAFLLAAVPGAAPDLPALLAVLYGGRPGLGLRALRDETRLAVLRDAIGCARAAAARDTYSLLSIFSRYEGRGEEDREKRDALLSDLSEALLVSLREISAPGLPVLPPGAAALLAPPVQEARTALRANAAPKITFTALAVELERAGT